MIVRFAAETLVGVPSIVPGLFGYLVFASTLHFQASRMKVLAGCYIHLIVLVNRLIVDTSIPLHKEYPLV